MSSAMQSGPLDPNWCVYIAPIRALLTAAEHRGHDPLVLAGSAGISKDVLSSPESRIPVKQYFQLIEQVVGLIDDNDIGLKTGRISFLTGLNLQLYMATICHSFRDYLNLMPSMLKLWGDIGEVKIAADGEFIRLEWRPLTQEHNDTRYLSDSVLASSAAIVDSLCIAPVPVRKACFTYGLPDDTAELTAVFGGALSFSQPISCLYFDRASLDYPLVQQDYSKRRDGPRSFSQLFDGRDPSDSFWPRLRQSIVRCLPRGGVKVSVVASDLHMSARTLQRRLQSQQTSFDAEVRAARLELAKRYLSSGKLSITEISFLLGYSGPGVFSAAFRKWMGHSPSAFQADQTNGAK
ncbi:MAG: hypothetical protein COB37_01435 [Kordiimonadales bacterium]|nr:MAG: hypothetical protein COB37_01435 [Kordiimonadales bacterium]